MAHPSSVVIIDLSSVTTVHQSFLNQLICARQQALAIGKTLALKSVSPEFRLALEITRLDNLFPEVG